MKRYFVCANSGKGFVNYFDSALKDIDKVFILKGGPGTGKSTLMKNLGKSFETRGVDVDYIHCSSDPDSLDGVIFNKLSVAVVDGTAPHVVEPSVAGAVGEYINIGSAWDIKMLENEKKNIKELQESISQCYNKAYEHLAMAKSLHDKLEEYYINATDYKIVDDIYDMMKNRIDEYMK